MTDVIDEFNPQEWEIANENEVEGKEWEPIPPGWSWSCFTLAISTQAYLLLAYVFERILYTHNRTQTVNVTHVKQFIERNGWESR